MRQKCNAFRVKELGDDGTFSGYGSVFDVIDSYRDIVLPGAFSETLKAHKSKGTMPKLLWQHDSCEPIGKYTEMREDKKGLYVEGQLAIKDNVPFADKAYSLLKMGAIDGLSIGFSVPAGGEAFNEDDTVWELSEIDLWETSIVTFAANPESNIEQVRHAIDAGEALTKRQLERHLRDAGLPGSMVKKLLSGGYSAIDGDHRDDDSELVKAVQEINSQIGGSE